MRIWDSMCETLLSTASRRGAMMATLRCDHPDIEAFIVAKQRAGQLRNFNLSVLVSDAFMQAVEDDVAWPLVFPAEGLGGGEHRAGRREVLRRWPGHAEAVPCLVLREVPARALWERIMRATYDFAEPGVLFVDRINQQNNLGYREHISATNPCGEIPLPPYGACNLGSINLTRFVREPFTAAAVLDLDGIAQAAATAVRLLDNVIDLSRFPLSAQAQQARGSRRIGLGLTGLADTLIMLGQHYASDEARQLATRTMQTLCHSAYRASIELAGEKGSFPFFERDALLRRPFVQRLPPDMRQGIAERGLRNSHLTAIAPTGTISLLANNVSSGTDAWHQLTDFALRHWRERFGDRPLPDCFVDAQHLSPDDHLAMQAALQPWVDNAISKTINVPANLAFDAFQAIYLKAYRQGLKGCTTYRPNAVTGAVLERSAGQASGSHCCDLEREND
jgi:ribonucleoside-diphosphate reductase alpha chain